MSRATRASSIARRGAVLAVLAPPPVDAPVRRPRRPTRRDVEEPPRRPGGGGPRDGGRGGGGGDGGRGDGAPEPRGTPPGSADLAFGFLLVAVCTLFLAFVLAWAMLREGDTWPSGARAHTPQGLWWSTALLIASEIAMARAAKPSDPRAARRWLACAALCGALFLGAQAWVWRVLIAEGRTASSDAYAAVFYSLTGLHALHVLGGLAYMLVVMRRLRRAASASGHGLGACRVYWHLMGAIWVLVFALLYFGA